MWLIQIASFVQSTVQNLKTIKEAGTSIFTWMCHLPKVQDKEDIHSQTGGQILEGNNIWIYDIPEQRQGMR